MNAPVILRTRGLSKEFRGFHAVRNVSLEIRRNTIHALIGPNGAGKTTCFNLLTTFLPASAGTIEFNGRDITRSDRTLDRHNARARELLGSVGLERYQTSMAADLSYGRKRALELATTLALDPELILLDEPIAGLGHEDIGPVTRLIAEVARQRTVLMVEHNMKVVAELCDRITVLQSGEVLAEGTYAEVSRDQRVIDAYVGGAHD